MKRILTCLIALIVLNTAKGQGNFEVGSNVIGVGIGLGSSYGGYGYGATESPGFNFQYERGMWEAGGPGVISLGGYLAFKSWSYDDGYGNSWGNSITIIGARSAYHYNGISSDQFDIYAGLMLGARILSWDDNFYGFNNNTDIIFSGFIGARYYFSSNIGAFVELGNGVSIMNLGIVFKF